MTANKWYFPGLDLQETSLASLTSLSAYIDQHYDQLLAKFIAQFAAYGQKISHMQAAGAKGPIGYIHLSLLQTNVLAKRHQLRLDAYDANWYADRAECSGAYDVTEYYTWLDTFAASLETAAKPMFRLGKLRELQAAILAESQKYLAIIAELVRAGLVQATATDWWQKIEREPVCAVLIGGYRDRCDILYQEDRTVKDPQTVKQRLAAKHQPAYSHETAADLDLSGGDYSNLNLLFARFTGCDFSHSRFNRTLILGGDFRRSRFTNADLTGSRLYHTDFSGALLENINFHGAELAHLTFNGAKLINVSFAGVTLAKELDFTQAQLVNTTLPPDQEAGA